MTTIQNQHHTQQEPGSALNAKRPKNGSGKPQQKVAGTKKGAVQPKIAGAEHRNVSKAAKVLQLLRQPGGATLKCLMKATEWQAHSVRGFLSGTLRKKMRLTVESTKIEGSERRYAIKP